MNNASTCLFMYFYTVCARIMIIIHTYNSIYLAVLCSFSAASGDLLAENFNPVWFLLEAHRYTSFFDLKLGLQRLKREVNQSDQAPVQFIRDNLDIFLQSYDTLSDILSIHTCTCTCTYMYCTYTVLPKLKLYNTIYWLMFS